MNEPHAKRDDTPENKQDVLTPEQFVHQSTANFLPDKEPEEDKPAPLAGSRSLVILGMHRSGTSSLAGMLQRLGVNFGHGLLAAKEDNQLGFYEHKMVVGLNEELFARAEGAWHEMIPTVRLEQAARQEHRALRRTARVLSEDFRGSPLWGLKDPRLCRLLPVWREVFATLGTEPLPVLVLRHPLESAASLRRRNGLTLRQGCLLWLLYNLEAEAATRQDPARVFLTYEALLSDWKAAAEKIRSRFGLTWPRSVEEVGPEIDRFVRPEMRHQVAQDSEECPPVVLRAFELLSGLAAADAATPPGDAIFRELDSLRQMLGDLLAALPAAQPEPLAPPREEPGETRYEELHFQVFHPRPSGVVDEFYSSLRRYYSDLGWKHFEILLPAVPVGAGHFALRLDPANHPAVVEIGAISLRSAFGGEPIWRAQNPGEFDGVIVTGTAQRTPHPRYLQIINHGTDAQVFLPGLPWQENGDPLFLEVWLRASTRENYLAEVIKPLLDSHQELEKSRRTQNALKQRVEELTQFNDERVEALRVQSVLRAEALKRDGFIRDLQAQLHTLENVPPAPLPELQVYFGKAGIFAEPNSVSLSLQPGRWQRISVPVPEGWRGGGLRLDPGQGFGLAEVSGVRLLTTTLGEEVWRLYGSELKDAALIQGNAQSVPGARTLRVLCAEDDPQIILPEVTADGFDEPLTLEIGIRLRTEWPALIHAFQELAREVSDWPAVQRQMRDLADDLSDAKQALAQTQATAAAQLQSLEQAHFQQEQARSRHLESVQARLDESENSNLDLAQEQRDLCGDLAALRQQETAATQEIEGLLSESYHLNLRLVEKDREAAELHRRLVEKDGALVAALARAETEYHRGRSMRRSFSWKLTLPLRIVHRWFTGQTTAQQRARLAPVSPAPPPEKEASFPAVSQAPSYRLHLDAPVNWNFPTRQCIVRGWCLPPEGSDEPIPALRFRCGDRQTEATCNLSRTDVQQAHGDNPRWRLCGFEVSLELPPGPSEVTVEAIDIRGEAWPLAIFSARAPYAADPARVMNPDGDPSRDYGAWIARYDSFSSDDRLRLRRQARELPHRPLISVVMPVYNAPEQWLVAAIDSVRRQFYPFWEFCIADDHSPQPHVQEVLRRYEKLDPRIKVVYRAQNGHISAASNSALEVATGEYVALLDHDDELAPHALLRIAEAVNAQPGLQMIYSDEDKIGLDGQRCDPYFKPDWNYDLFLGQNVFSHLGVYRRDLLNEIGGFQLGIEGSQDYDLALRCLERVKPQEIGHVPHVLYHWRMIPGSTSIGGDEKPYAREAARRAIGQHLARLGRGATVEQNPWLADFHRVRHPLPAPAPEVALIIPTRDHVEVLRTCIETTLQHTDYPNYRFVVVDNGSQEPATKRYFQELRRRLPGRFEVLDYPGEFNFSAINNFAVRETGAPLLCFLNNDIEVTTPDWLTELVSQACRPEVGAAGARLLYPDGTLQHAGIIIGLGADRTAGHAHHRLPEREFGYFGRAKLVQQFSAVTAACLVMRREIFDGAGGFDEENFPVGLNDVDLCLRLREKGYLIIWTPFATLTHHESYSRGVPAPGTPAARRAQEEVARFQRRHACFIEADPAYNPNLTLDHADFSSSAPTRHGQRNASPDEEKSVDYQPT